MTNMWPTADAPQFGIFVSEQVDALRDLGVVVDVMFIDGRAHRLNYLRAVGELRSRLRHGRYDLIHAHYALTAVAALAQTKLPVVVTHHGIEVFSGWQSVVARAVSRRAAHVIVVGHKLQERLGLRGATVIGNGVDLGRFAPADMKSARRELRIDEEARVVLFVGEPRPEKRIDLIDAAVSLVRERWDSVELRIVTGRSRSEVAREMNAADVLVLASDNEGDPVVIKEAMACNLPIVSTDVGTVKDTIDGVAGCYLVEQTPSAIATGLQTALQFNGRTAGRMRVSSQTWDSVAERLVGTYVRVLTSLASCAPQQSEDKAVGCSGL